MIPARRRLALLPLLAALLVHWSAAGASAASQGKPASLPAAVVKGLASKAFAPDFAHVSKSLSAQLPLARDPANFPAALKASITHPQDAAAARALLDALQDPAAFAKLARGLRSKDNPHSASSARELIKSLNALRRPEVLESLLPLQQALKAVPEEASSRVKGSLDRLFTGSDFLDERAERPFPRPEDLRLALDSWDDELWRSAGAKDEKPLPPSLDYSIPYRRRVELAEFILKAKPELLEAVTEVQEATRDPGPSVTGGSAVDAFGSAIRRRMPVIAPLERYQDESWARVKSEIEQVVSDSGFKSLRAGKAQEAVDGYFSRVETLKEKYGSELFARDVVMNAAFTSIGGGVFLSLAHLPLHDAAALDAIAMLAPLTDDALDQGRDVGRAMRKIGALLQGKRQKAEDVFERVVFDLIARILRTHPPSQDPAVLSAMQILHETQLSTVTKQRDPSATLEEVVRITSRKGGLAVVLAAYLSFGRLYEREIEYFYKLGAVFQLADDLVDYEDDLKDGTMTVWTRARRSGEPFGAAFDLWMRQQRLLEAQSAGLLSAMPASQDIIGGVSFAHKVYLLGALLQPGIGSQVYARVKDKFPFSRDNLRKALFAFLAQLETRSDRRLKMIAVMDRNVLKGQYQAFREKSRAPPARILSLSGPWLYWGLVKFSSAIGRFHKKVLESQHLTFLWFTALLALSMNMVHQLPEWLSSIIYIASFGFLIHKWTRGLIYLWFLASLVYFGRALGLY